MNPIYGIDLDNTLIDYTPSLIKLVKDKYPSLILKTFTKDEIKSKIIEVLNENEWTKCQSLLYSDYLKFATVHKHALFFLRKAIESGIEIKIISHKTEYPILGKRIALRSLALDWINTNISSELNIEFQIDNNLFFTDTIDSKIEIILKNKCEIFVDDLEKILLLLPDNIKKYWIFSSLQSNNKNIQSILDWKELTNEFGF